MAEAGVTREHLAKVLNHIEGGAAATRVYDRYSFDAEKRQALELWARRLAAIIEGKTPQGRRHSRLIALPLKSLFKRIYDLIVLLKVDEAKSAKHLKERGIRVRALC